MKFFLFIRYRYFMFCIVILFQFFCKITQINFIHIFNLLVLCYFVFVGCLQAIFVWSSDVIIGWIYTWNLCFFLLVLRRALFLIFFVDLLLITLSNIMMNLFYWLNNVIWLNLISIFLLWIFIVNLTLWFFCFHLWNWFTIFLFQRFNSYFDITLNPTIFCILQMFFCYFFLLNFYNFDK